jgi:hypothetical protein
VHLDGTVDNKMVRCNCRTMDYVQRMVLLPGWSQKTLLEKVWVLCPEQRVEQRHTDGKVVAKCY